MLFKSILFGLLASVPVFAAVQVGASPVDLVEKREFSGSLAARAVATLVKKHHTEAQIATKNAAAAAKASTSTTSTSTSTSTNCKRQEADEFGPWDTEEDEFGSWAKREASPHHTEAQIAAKQAAAAKAAGGC